MLSAIHEFRNSWNPTEPDKLVILLTNSISPWTTEGEVGTQRPSGWDNAYGAALCNPSAQAIAEWNAAAAAWSRPETQGFYLHVQFS